MPARMLHLIYCEYIKVQLDESKKQASEGEAVMDELEDAMT